MSIKTKSMHITPAGGNVFADLGFPPQEARRLKAQSRKIISEKSKLKQQLLAELTDWMEQENLKQVDAALKLGVTRPRVSDVKTRKEKKHKNHSN